MADQPLSMEMGCGAGHHRGAEVSRGRVPARLEAKVNGPPLMTIRLFIRGLAELMSEHRQAIERVVAEQVREPQPIEALLAAAPLPAGSDDESDGELMGAIGAAIGAHLEALGWAPQPIRAESTDH
jgi:hypothetical protein